LEARGAVDRGVGGVEVTTRHASAAPQRLGSIRVLDFRRRFLGTGPSTPPTPRSTAPRVFAFVEHFGGLA